LKEFESENKSLALRLELSGARYPNGTATPTSARKSPPRNNRTPAPAEVSERPSV